jgi:hypothetical protein
MPASPNPELRRQILRLLEGDGAHAPYADVLRGVRPAARGRRVAGHKHTAWQLLEHMRIVQWDILEFSRNPEHVSPEFPSGYWPKSGSPPNPRAWGRSVAAFLADLEAMRSLVRKSRDVCAPIPHTGGVSLLREALLVADHNAYHLGQLQAVTRAR